MVYYIYHLITAIKYTFTNHLSLYDIGVNTVETNFIPLMHHFLRICCVVAI